MISSERRTQLSQAARRLPRRLALGGRFVSLRRTRPVSRLFGVDRGTPVDRVYIERFLAAETARIRGRVLELGDAGYTRRFGHGVTSSDVLHAVAGNPQATIVGDLADPATLPAERFDCIVLTQTLQFVPDPAAALRSCHAALAPGGALLVTATGIGQVSRYDMDRWGEFWRFTDRGLHELLAAAFGPGHVRVGQHGNVASACAFLQGVAAEELPAGVLERDDPDYPVLVVGVATR